MVTKGNLVCEGDPCSPAHAIVAASKRLHSEPLSLEGEVVYLFFDEAGDFNLTTKGSKYFILCCALTTRPFDCADELISLRRDYLERGPDIEYFHATNDHKRVRAEVFEVLLECSDDFAVYYSAVSKKGSFPGYKTPGDMYCKLFEDVFFLVQQDYDLSSACKVIAVTDCLPSEVRKKQYMLRLKEALKRVSSDYRIVHRRSMSDTNLQVVDYYCWAVQRDMERGDDSFVRDLKAIRSSLCVVQDEEEMEELQRQRPPVADGPCDHPGYPAKGKFAT